MRNRAVSVLTRLPLLSRQLATAPRTGQWGSLSSAHRQAWEALGWTAESWVGKGAPPVSSSAAWAQLTPAERAAATHGLGWTEDEWDRSSRDRSSPAAPQPDRAQSASSELMPAVETERPAWASAAWSLAKAMAPAVGTALSTGAQRGVGGRNGASNPVLHLAGLAVASLPSIADSMSERVLVNGVETTLFLDDSASMLGSGLHEGKKALDALGYLLDGPTRVVKFGGCKRVLAPREKDGFSTSLVSFAWDATSGGTYMWKMIEEDVVERYTPGSGKLRLVVVTDGHDNLSPGEYNGIDGMNPMMAALQGKGFDIEWHIIVLGEVQQKRVYASLARATGGSFLAVPGSFDEDGTNETAFLDALDDSSDMSEGDRKRHGRQQAYKLDAGTGKAAKFGWFKALPPPKPS